jgi:hypothetical protein
VRQNINVPASIPFGGNGFWGMYGDFDGIFELKEDLKAGLILRFQKRITRTLCQRLSVGGEPYIFGVTTGEVEIEPGVTIAFSPYVILENLRSGFGLSLQYNLTWHNQDDWYDKRPNKAELPVLIKQAVELSSWGADYVTLNAFYDFGKPKLFRSFDPIASLRWDIPANFFVSSRSVKTTRVSLGVEFAF